MKTISDKSTRKEAIPFLAYSWQGFEWDGSNIIFKDASNILSDTDYIVPIRCSTPFGSNLVEAHLNLNISVTSQLGVKVAIGYFDTDDIEAVADYSDTYIDSQHEFLTGSSDYIYSSGSTLFIDGLNIYPKIPKRGDTNFNENGFVLLLKFDRVRNSNTEEVKKFDVSASTLLGLI